MTAAEIEDRQAEIEVCRRDGSVEVSQEPAGDARVERADRERQQLGAKQVHAEDFRGDVAVADGNEGAPHISP